MSTAAVARQHREWCESQKENGIDWKGNSRPRVNGKLDYSVTVNNPLCDKERVQPKKKVSVKSTKEGKANGRSEAKPARSPEVYEHTKNLKWNPDPVPCLQPES